MIETICDPLTRAESLGIRNDTNGSNGGRPNVAITDFEVLHNAQDNVPQCYAHEHYIHQFDKLFNRKTPSDGKKKHFTFDESFCTALVRYVMMELGTNETTYTFLCRFYSSFFLLFQRSDNSRDNQYKKKKNVSQSTFILKIGLFQSNRITKKKTKINIYLS